MPPETRRRASRSQTRSHSIYELGPEPPRLRVPLASVATRALLPARSAAAAPACTNAIQLQQSHAKVSVLPMTRHHLFVCTNSRSPAEVREPRHQRAGAGLFHLLTIHYREGAQQQGIVIAPYECLSACPRPCAIALRAPAKFNYVFGDQQPCGTEAAIIECATRYRHIATGQRPRHERPRVMQAGTLARVPPLEAP
jgi:predicted metal-binding protein